MSRLVGFFKQSLVHGSEFSQVLGAIKANIFYFHLLVHTCFILLITKAYHSLHNGVVQGGIKSNIVWFFIKISMNWFVALWPTQLSYHTTFETPIEIILVIPRFLKIIAKNTLVHLILWTWLAVYSRDVVRNTNNYILGLKKST